MLKIPKTGEGQILIALYKMWNTFNPNAMDIKQNLSALAI